MLNKVAQDFPKLSKETRLFLGKAMALFMDAQTETPRPDSRGVL